MNRQFMGLNRMDIDVEKEEYERVLLLYTNLYKFGRMYMRSKEWRNKR